MKTQLLPKLRSEDLTIRGWPHPAKLMALTAKLVDFPKFSEVGDYFAITMEKKEGIEQQIFDRFQNHFDQFIQRAKDRGYTVRSGMQVKGEPPLAVVFIKEESE